MTPEEYATNSPQEEERKKQTAAPLPPPQPLQLPTPPFQNIAAGARLFSFIPVFVAIGVSIAVFAIIVAIGPEATTLEASPETQIGSGSAPTPGRIVPVGQGGAKIASAARQIAQQLVKPSSATASYCAPGDSFHCWDNANQFKMAKFNQEGVITYVQCTEFIWAVLGDDAVGYQKEIASIKNHDAYLWVDRARGNPEAQKYFHIIPPEEASQLQPGDIISAGGGIGPDGYPWGHVAIVIAREGSRVEVAQAGTAKNTEDWFITNGRLVSPFRSTAREPIQGFFRIKTP